MDKPLKVKLPRSGAVWLGDLYLCEPALNWLRRNFPRGGTFFRAWQNCPEGDEWLGYAARELCRIAHGDGSRQYKAMIARTCGKTAASIRAAVPYDEIEGLIRKVLAGRPEVVR